jgi:protocatechuate 3,4-dioxygenase beta subunit
MKRSIISLSFALFFSTLIVSAQAAKATIEGSVVRAGTGQPLKGATVTLRRVGAGQNRAAALDLNSPDLQNRLGALLTNVAGGVSVTTDASGRFTMTGVDPGDYMISAEREGFVRSEFGQRTPTGSGVAVKLIANQRFTASLPMTQASVISGRVLTLDGDPALNAEVEAYTYRYSNGERALAQVGSAKTNDLGEYRLFGLEPGDYFVSVTSEDLAADQTPVGTVDVSQQQAALRGGRGGGQGVQGIIAAALGERGGPIVQALAGAGTGNPPVYYPGTIDPDGATPVTVAAAAEVRGIDFNLRPSRTATVSGRVIAPFPLSASAEPAGPRGGRRGNFEIAQLLGAGPVQVNLTREGTSRTGLDGLIGLRFGSTPVSPDGSFEIKGVAPGEYNLTATGRDPNGQEHTARTRISVSSADVNNVALSLRPGVEVRGRIALETTPSQQFQMSNLRVSLVAEGAALPNILNLAGGAGGRGGGLVAQLRGGGQITSETVAEDGSFTLKNVGAQEYRVRVTGLPQGAFLQSGRIGSIDALNAPFNVNDSSAVLQLQIGFSAGRVSGAVADARGAAAPGAQVVLVPDEARRGRSDAYFTANSDQNGQFTLSNVPPGSYKLFAWEDIPAGAYQYPDFLRRYEDRGQAVTVNANGTITATVRLIPAS